MPSNAVAESRRGSNGFACHIRILDGSEVSGNVVVRKPGGWSWGKRDKPVRVEISKDETVHGNLVFEHAVELEIHDTARVGEIIGENVEIVTSSWIT